MTEGGALAVLQSNGKASRMPTKAIALALLLVLGGAAIVAYPEAGALACLTVWGIALAWGLSRELAIAIPFALLLIVPADHIVGLNGSTLGLAVLGGATILFLSSLLRGHFRNPLERDWDCLALVAVLVTATLLQARSGEVRGILFWAAAAMILCWLRAEERECRSVSAQIAVAIIAAGAISSMVAIVDFVGIVKASAVVPRYEPAQLDFADTLGLRASGISGHPLRLGTLSMVSSLVTLSWLIERKGSDRYRTLALVAIAITLAGLVLSGARGSWVGFVVGYIAISSQRWGRAALRALWRSTILFAGFGVLLLLTGLWPFVYERLFGSAFHPGSIGQRLAALQSVLIIWRDVPLFGVGFGGAVDLTQKAGLRLPNLENDYLRFFLTAGIVGPVSLLTIGVRRVLLALRDIPSWRRTAALAALLSLFVNIATYNLFSWSVAPALFFAVAMIGDPTPSTRRGSLQRIE